MSAIWTNVIGMLKQLDGSSYLPEEFSVLNFPVIFPGQINHSELLWKQELLQSSTIFYNRIMSYRIVLNLIVSYRIVSFI